MKLKRIYYERLKSGPGFNNTRVGVELELNDGDKVKDVLDKAKDLVALSLGENQRELDFSDLPF